MNTKPKLSRLRGALSIAMVLIGAAAAFVVPTTLHCEHGITLGAPGLHAGSPKSGLQAAPGDVIWFTPDTAADPRWKDFHYPVYLHNPLGLPVCDRASLHITISYYSTLFFLRSVSVGSMVQRQEGDSTVVDIDLSGTSAITSGTVVELIGDVLDGSEQSTRFAIRSITCSGAAITDSVRTGSLFLGPGFCEQGSDRLLVYTEPFSINKIAPNPASGSVTISVTTMVPEETWLDVYAMDGRRVYATSWTPPGSQQSDLKRDIVLPDELSSGIYRVVLRSPERSDSRTLLITR